VSDRPPTFAADLPGIGEAFICPEAVAVARQKAGEIAFSYAEFDALDAAAEANLGGPELACAIARVKKTFPSATINRILTVEEAKLDAESRNGIPAGDLRRQVGRPPAIAPEAMACPACGGKGGCLDGCSFGGG
jgi:hypothetical protein